MQFYRFDGKSELEVYDGRDIFGAMVAGTVLTIMLLGAMAAFCLVAAFCLMVTAKKRARERRNPNSKGDVVVPANSSVVVKDCNSQVQYIEMDKKAGSRFRELSDLRTVNLGSNAAELLQLGASLMGPVL